MTTTKAEQSWWRSEAVVVVDANNVRGALGFRADVARLVAACGTALRRAPGPLLIVAVDHGPASSAALTRPDLVVGFAGEHQRSSAARTYATADDLVVATVGLIAVRRGQLNPPATCVAVVTSDRQLARRCKAAGTRSAMRVRVVPSLDLAAILEPYLDDSDDDTVMFAGASFPIARVATGHRHPGGFSARGDPAKKTASAAVAGTTTTTTTLILQTVWWWWVSLFSLVITTTVEKLVRRPRALRVDDADDDPWLEGCSPLVRRAARRTRPEVVVPTVRRSRVSGSCGGWTAETTPERCVQAQALHDRLDARIRLRAGHASSVSDDTAGAPAWLQEFLARHPWPVVTTTTTAGGK